MPYYRLNSDDLATTDVLALVDGRSETRRLGSQGATVDLADVGCVWYRRAVRPPPPPGTSSDFHGFAVAELRHLFEGLIADDSVRWVNPIGASDVAERKLYQLRIAAASGLTAPATIVSNDPTELRAFAAGQERVICKPLSQGLVRAQSSWYVVHTREVDGGELATAPELRDLPTMLQRLVPRGTDFRLTVIGSETFAAKVITPPDAPIDWRAARTLRYRASSIPAEVERGCRAMMSRLGIVYGAFDFIRTDDGEWYFLEVNPAGEWAWLEVELDMRMRDAFISLFYGD